MEKLIKNTFEKPFDPERFDYFIRSLLSGVEKRDSWIQVSKDYTDFIKSYKRIGKYVDPDYNIIEVLIVYLKRTTSIERARTAQRNFVARYLNRTMGDVPRDAALVAFVNEDNLDDWRFSLIKMDYIRENNKIFQEVSPAKRFSFLVGVNEKSYTAKNQLLKYLNKTKDGEEITLADLVDAFNIEKVTDEFFEKYKARFEDLKNELDRLYTTDKKIKEDFDRNNINRVDFAKKTLGQLVFLYFLQKKGWLGVQCGDSWGNGDKKFLRRLFDKEYKDYDNFFNDILEPLFYKALREDRKNKNDLFEDLNCRIPFLNGGLFDPINDYNWENTNITVDNKIFEKIFETFDLYNFTVKEDEPLEKEVAVDPEMLGNVFEKLLDVNEQKSKGAFYTPREIVHYMCQQSLINYLSSEIKNISLEDFSEFIKIADNTYENKTRKIGKSLPDIIINNAIKIDEKLRDIKVCDPAIGSGAFPVGMMNEIVRARLALEEFIPNSNKTAYKLKRHTIENSIYGVDIDAGAIEIAKLRFWLSLVVDEENTQEIQPLPNLDYKLMQGNSLIPIKEDIDFDDLFSGGFQYEQRNLFAETTQTYFDELVSQLKEAKIDYSKTPHKEKKAELRNKIEELIQELIEVKIKKKQESKEQFICSKANCTKILAEHNKEREFFPWKLYFSEVFQSKKAGFDVIIGNPPYGANLTQFEKTICKKQYSNVIVRTLDTFIFFISKAHKLLTKSGVLSYIVPNNLLFQVECEKTRELLLKEYIISCVINLGDKVFKSADVPTCIFIANKGVKKSYNFRYADLRSFEDKISNINFESFMADIEKKDILGISSYVFGIDKKANQIIAKLKNKSLILDEIVSDASYGICTGGDKIFRISEEFADKNKFEKELLFKVLVGSDIDKYYIKDNQYKVIYITKDLNIDNYPYVYNYLKPFQDKLSSKRETKKGTLPWWCLWWPRNKDLLCGEKIILRQTGDSIKATFDNSDFFVLDSVMIIKIKGNSNIEYKFILSILNSKLTNYIYRTLTQEEGRAFAQVKPKNIRKLFVPKCLKNQQWFIDKVNEIIKITESQDYLDNILKQTQVKEYQKLIDITLYKFYDLTFEEVKIIDPDFNQSEQEYNNFILDFVKPVSKGEANEIKYQDHTITSKESCIINLDQLKAFCFICSNSKKKKPSARDIIEKISNDIPELLDNDRVFMDVFDAIALNNGYTKEDLPKYWTVGRQIFDYKKEKGIKAPPEASKRVSLTHTINIDKDLVKQFIFIKPDGRQYKPSVKEIIIKIADIKPGYMIDDRAFVELFDSVALSNGYDENNLPKYWNIIRAIFDYKKKFNI